MNRKATFVAVISALTVTAITTVCACNSADETSAPSNIGVGNTAKITETAHVELDNLADIGKEASDARKFTNREFNPDEWTAVTATWYCPCYKCCGKWALNRPKHDDGTEIVYGAYGDELKDGISIASSVYPAGTVLEIYGIGTRVVQDTGVSHDGVDFYCTDHELAIENGMQTVYIREITK